MLWPTMKRIAALVFAVLLMPACAVLAQDRGQDRAQLDSISVHLFLTKSGTLSEDVEKVEGFGAWNFSVQGTGLAPDERFYSILIKVRLTASREVFAKGKQAEILVTDRRSKKVIKRERISNVYIGSNGWVILPVWVQDAACGPFEIVATGREKKITKQFESACGE